MNQAILMSESGDLGFMIEGIVSFELFGQTVWLTTSHACILIIMAVIIGFCIVANRKLKKATDVPAGFQTISELIVELLQGMVGDTMGKWAPGFMNYIGTIFMFILLSNIPDCLV